MRVDKGVLGIADHIANGSRLSEQKQRKTNNETDSQGRQGKTQTDLYRAILPKITRTRTTNN